MRIAFFISLILLASCVPESKKLNTEVSVDSDNLSFRKITDLQHGAYQDSILPFLKSEDPTERYLAARAFASRQDFKAIDSLASLLNDPIIKVRAMAAYAMGQQSASPSEQVLLNGFRAADTMSVDNPGNGAILEALGKVGGEPLANFIATADGYRAQDTLLLEGQMQSLFQFAMRGIHDPTTTEKALSVIKNKSIPAKARLYAAHYFARADSLDVEKIKFQLAESLVEESDVNVKMALATAMKHTSDPEIQVTLLDQLDLQQDYRVKCNLIRSLRSYDKVATLPKLQEQLRSDNMHVAMTAATILGELGDPNNVGPFRNIAKDSIPWQLKTRLYKSILEVLPYYYTKTKNATRWQLMQALDKETDPVVISAYINALGADPENYDFIQQFVEKRDTSCITTAGVQAMSEILGDKDFNLVYQFLSRSMRRKTLAYFQTLLEKQDEGVTALIADAIANPLTGLDVLIDSTEFLHTAKNSLNLPAQIETAHALDKAIAHMRGVKNPTLTKVDGTKKIEWSTLSAYKGNIKAIVKTTKGAFTIMLLHEAAPISVSNFIELSNQNFYDEKMFHRVVPNFVIQTGSPRGDNYGGADHLITSELSPIHYDEAGYVGMASAGLHTESSQWFVTHSPTPHLDGRYTIFGKVTEGMDVVHAIQVGDKILDIIVTDL